ncbi:hypothetical protein R3X27_19545 [Tropicimonas sp. TH_r6]|uniref:hypothetical protein n=1 Tax=Tropicimonas sp. TH_r6 TaxID=3082085 RepID=UPI00295456D8|nr:hypothetical protein [Tropicimonas sp. TH_r6]MDV7144880.1 hypothetical protein [Tropicimonas sp. TH_r6]
MISAIFRLPWYGNLLFAAIFAFGAYWIHGEVEREEAEKAVALSVGPPRPVTLADFDPKRDTHPADEVHLLGWINPDYTYTLVEEKNGRVQRERLMYVLFDGNQDAEARMAHAAIILPPAQKGAFAAWLKKGNSLSQIAEDTFGRELSLPVSRFNGARDRSPDLEELARDAFDEAGLTRAPNFLYIEPWIEGRAAALAPEPETAGQVALVLGTVAGVFLALAVTKLLMRRGGRSNRAERVSGQPGAAAKRGDPQLQRMLDASEKELQRLHKHKTARPSFAQSRIPSLFALVFFLGYYLYMSSGGSVPHWMMTGEVLLPAFIALLVPLYLAYRFGYLDWLNGRSAGNVVQEEATQPFHKTLPARILGYSFVLAYLFMPMLLPVLLLIYGGAYLHSRFRRPNAKVRENVGRSVDLNRYFGSGKTLEPVDDANKGWEPASAAPHAHVVENPWGEPGPAARRSVPANAHNPGPDPATVAKPSQLRGKIETPFSDAVRRKAKEDPFERLRQRYPHLQPKGH